MNTDLIRQQNRFWNHAKDFVLPILIPGLVMALIVAISLIPLPTWQVQFTKPTCQALINRGIRVDPIGNEPEQGCRASLPFKITGSTARIQVDLNGRPTRMNIPLQGIVLAEKE